MHFDCNMDSPHDSWQSASSAKNEETGTDVAIKKISKVFEKKIIAKRTLRELKLLRHFNGHENVCLRLATGKVSLRRL